MADIVARVWVDPDKCQGHNRCRAIARDLFEIDDLGYASAIADGSVTAEQLEKAELAVKNCPEFAVVLERL